MDWWGLPSVVLVEIYKYLPVKDRLYASLTCRNWRLPAFQVPLRDELNLCLRKAGDIPKVRFLIQQFILKVKHVNFEFNAAVPNCLDLVGEALALLETNYELKTLKLTCSENSITNRLFYREDNQNDLMLRRYFTRKVLGPLLKVLKTRNNLETFGFPLIQKMSSDGNTIFSILVDSHKRYSIQNLFLASVRDFSVLDNSPSPRWYPSIELNRVDCFANLQMLSVDHDSLSDDILATIGVGSVVGGLKRLNLVAVKDNPDVSNQGWVVFVENNRQCKVRVTVTGGSGLVSGASNLIFPSIPLSHFRTYYCKGMRMNFLNSVVRWNESTLEHLELVDEKYDWGEFLAESGNEEDQFLDPIVYAAWRCKKLHTIKIGFIYCGHSLVGIARLKGPSLLQLEIPKSQVRYHCFKQLNKEVSKALERPWKPVEISRYEKHTYKTKGPLVRTLRALHDDGNY